MPRGAILSGWTSRALQLNSEAYAIHHPDGGLKKYTAADIISIVDGGDPDYPLTNAIRLLWETCVSPCRAEWRDW